MSDQYAYYNQISDRKNNKVYINPNFNGSYAPTTVQSNNMYVNPNFSHIETNSYSHHSVQDPAIHTSKTRIHVNPNFLRNANISKPMITNNPIKSTPTSSDSISNTVFRKDHNQTPGTLAHVSKSRYCLVRQKENLSFISPALKPIATTVKVNKYKSVSLNEIKNNLDTVRPNTTNAVSLQNEKYQSKLIVATPNKNSRFKFVKPNSASTLLQSQAKNVDVRRYSYLKKSMPKKPSKKNSRLVLQKNNIPCSLFKKYGKCLRKVRGTCDYLHDKKHVSICRKFLKGVCHDKDCLLSHDLTVKKMPTCYFYLQGACTKENCPYLHVKLNEKTKICKDFLTGYCEKGDKCLFRHINFCRDVLKKVSSKQFTYLPAGKTKVVKIKSQKKSHIVQTQEMCPTNKNEIHIDYHSEPHRYFKESMEDANSDDKCNIIKPSRIKLGQLPAFIQL